MKNVACVSAAVVMCLMLSACEEPIALDENSPDVEPTMFTYTEVSASGLRPLRPFPNSGDVCLLLKDSKKTAFLKTEGRALLACPKHEKGAIADRREQGARIVAHVKHWLILSISEKKVR